MLRGLLTLVVCLAVVELCYASTMGRRSGRYLGNKVLAISCKSKDHIAAIRKLNFDFDVWSEPRRIGREARVMVPPSKSQLFDQFSEQHGLTSKVVIEDVQRLVDEEAAAMIGAPKVLEWTKYHPLDEIYAWLDAQAEKFDGVSVVNVGETYENRTIRALKINNGNNLPGLILESGIHAREWIGPAATSWIVNEILNSPKDSIWRKYNYLYVPNLNPDGYVYTWTEERLWRKTRKPYGNDGCVGADPNRNFDNHWLEGGGASSNPCSETYAGPEPFSEIETKSFSDYLRSVSADYDLYIAFHSAAQLLIFPWGWTPKPAALHDLWQTIGDKSAAEIAKVNGTIFEVGDIYNTIYPASGSSMEWYYGEFNSTITFCYELRNGFGFEMPPEYIIPVGQEQLADPTSGTSVEWYYGEFNSTISYTFEMRRGYGFELPPEFIIPCGKEHLAGLDSILRDYQKLL